MKQSKTTLRELTHRYRAVLLKCALLNLAAFAVALPVKAENIVIGDGDTATYTRVAKEGQNNRYTIKVNNNAEEFVNSSPDSLKMTGGNLIVESKVGDGLDWQGTGGINISGGTVSAKKEESLSAYRGALSISGNAVINTAMMSDIGTTISGGKITLADTEDVNKELYFGKGLGIDAADEQTSGTLSISGGDITLGNNRQIVLVREWGDYDTENLPAAYHGDIKISGGNITLNKNSQIIRTDNDNNEVGETLVFNYLKDSRPNELSKTTGEINISGGTITLNDTASIVNHSSDGTIRISDKAIINVNGNNRFENAKGIATADFSGGAINLNGTLTANIAATGGSLTVNKGGNLNGKLSGTLNDLTISGGELTIEDLVQTDSFTMTDGHLTIRGTNKDWSENGGLRSSSDASTISGGKLTLLTPNQSNDSNSDGVNLYFNGLTVTGKNTVLDFSGNSRIRVDNQFNVTDATIYVHDALQEPIDGTGTINFTNVTTIVSNASFSPWDAGLSNDVTITDDEYNALPENQKARYVKEQSRQNYYKILKDPLTGKYFSAEDAKKYRLYEEVYHKAGDFTINGGTLSVSKGSFATDRNIITDGTKISLSNASYMAVAGEDEYSDGSLFNQELTFKGNSTVNVSGGSYIFTGHMHLPYQEADDYYLDNGLLTEADMAKSAKPNEANANINIQDSTIITLNDTSAIALLDKNSGTINLTGGKINMNDSSSIYGSLIVDGGELNVNGNNSVKNNLYITGNWDKTVSNGMGSILFWEAEGAAPAINLQSGTINLNGALTGNIAATGGTIAFGKESARLNGILSGSNVDLIFKDNYLLSNLNNKATLKNITISAGKTLDIGTGTLTADRISGGTISAILTDAAQTSAIITANADNVTLKLDMSNASRDKATLYKITSSNTEFTFGDYATNRYAVSTKSFGKNEAKTLGKLSGWNGGDLWILRLATASEAAIEDLEAAGVKLPENEKQASKILDLANDVLDKLEDSARKNIEKINDLLDKAAGKTEQVKQILKEIAPDASSSGAKTASNTAKSVINVINSRFGGSPRRGRSGGDYTVGQTAVWAQGMMNYAKLDTDNGFDAHSNGFAAGFEANFTDSFKAGLGYAYTSTDISTERSKTDVKTHTGFVYGEYKPNKAYINGVVSFGRSDYDDTTRSLSLTSAYKTDTIAAQIAAGYKAGVLTPEAAVRFTNVKQKAYTDATGAKMEEKTSDTWTGVLGAKIGKNYVLRANRKIGLSPELKVAATYDFARDDENRTVTLPDGSSYTATGEAMERFGVEAGAGLTIGLGNMSEIALTYDGKFKEHYQDHTGMLNLKVKF